MYEEGQQFDVEASMIKLFIPEGLKTNLREVPVSHVELTNVNEDEETADVKHIAPDGSNWRTLSLSFSEIEEAQDDWLASQPRALTGTSEGVPV